MKRRLALAAALAVTTSLLAVPGLANAIPASSYGTVAGHVRSSAGTPLAGIRIHIAKKVTTTDKNGRYSIKVLPAVRTITVEDVKGTYADETASKAVTVLAGKKTIFDQTLRKAASVTGRVSSEAGGSASDVTVAAVPLDGSNSTVFATSSSTGVYVLKGLSPNRYTLQFSVLGDAGYQPEFLGDAATKQAGRSFELAYGQKLTGQSETLTPSAAITGKLYVDGARVQPDLESTKAVLTDAAGAVVATSYVHDTFKFRGLPAGDYRIAFTPNTDEWIIPGYYGDTTDSAAQGTLHVDAGQKLTGLAVTLTRAPVTHHMITAIDTVVPTAVTRGKTITVKVDVRSYGDTAGARVDLIWGSTVRTSGVVATDGTVTLRAKAVDLARGDRRLKIYYQGTATTERHPVYVHVTVR